LGLLFLIILLASFSNYHVIIHIFWLSSSLKFVIYGLLGILGVLLLATGQIETKAIGTIDLSIFVFLTYNLGNTIYKAMPNLPPEDIYSLVLVFLYYFLIRFSRFQKTIAPIKELSTGIIILATFQAILGIFQQHGLSAPYSDNFKTAGTFINPGIYGCFLIMGLLLCTNGLMNTACTPIKRLFYAISFTVIFPALIYCGSRTSWLAFFGGLSCILLIKIYQSGTINKYKWALLALAGIAFSLSITFISATNTKSIDGRFLIWKISIPMAMIKPITGLGYGSFFVQYGDYQATYFLNENATQNEILLASMNYYPFNEYLKMFIEGGAVGFLLFILILGSFARYIYQKKESLHQYHPLLLPTVLPVSTALLLFGLFSYPSQDISISIILLSLLSWIGRLQSEDKESRHFNLLRDNNIKYTLAMVCGLITFGSAIKIQAILKWRVAQENILLQEGSSLSTYANILPILSNNGAFLYNYGAELHDLGMTAKAERILKRASVYGNSVELQLKRADNYVELGKSNLAEEYYLRAVHMNPKLFVPFGILLDFYLKTGQKDKMQKLANILCHKPMKVHSQQAIEIKERACRCIK